MTDEFKAGEVYRDAGADYWTADIDVGEHYGRIQCYGRPEEEARRFRDEVLDALRQPTTPTTGEDDVEVTRADRDAAAGYCQDKELGDRFKAGELDDHSYVQMFARHRLAAISPTTEDAEKLRASAFDEAAQIAISHSNYGHVEGNERAFRIADDIKARSKSILASIGERS